MTGRGLVLGSGGVTGISWEAGILAGLARQGIDLTAADLVVGTSAGAVVAAQITSGTPLAELYHAQFGPTLPDVEARMGLGLKLRFLWALGGTRKTAKSLLRFGRMALATRPIEEARRLAVFEAWLPTADWPARPLLITAVDADSGEFVAFDAGGEASLTEAVAASCAVPGVWPTVWINGRRWMDGGIRTAANADLAARCDQIVVLAPLPKGFGTMPGAARQCELLAAGGRAVTMVAPDRQALAAIGKNMLDPARCAAAAQAGYAQAAAVADDVRRVWEHEGARRRTV